jgi:hypothetical protein
MPDTTVRSTLAEGASGMLEGSRIDCGMLMANRFARDPGGLKAERNGIGGAPMTLASVAWSRRGLESTKLHNITMAKSEPHVGSANLLTICD